MPLFMGTRKLLIKYSHLLYFRELRQKYHLIIKNILSHYIMSKLKLTTNNLSQISPTIKIYQMVKYLIILAIRYKIKTINETNRIKRLKIIANWRGNKLRIIKDVGNLLRTFFVVEPKKKRIPKKIKIF